MLHINQQKLPRTVLSYLSFRMSGVATLQFIELSRQLPDVDLESQGFLTEVPFLREVPPHVQIELLAETWSKHVAEKPYEASLLDESVIYAACETASYIVQNNPELVPSLLSGGPLEAQIDVGQELAESLQKLHLNLANEGDFLLISQFMDMPPEECQEWKQRYGLEDADIEPMFDALARWNISPSVEQNLSGLFSPNEIRRMLPLLGVRAHDPAES
ncbi:hypothetical protein Pan258_08700 [Symmachiella dynata]|uniref:hypothetical protein n=1 Tax=Symmachiella dynata TaxID=2527995 RepID=UPI0011888036|nr:hypothetical protein [Symmachiella dynata]QDT46850.1 hypothetical protein Pan258_08700 [Symmachiella dynata]